MRATTLKWGYISKEIWVEGDYTRLEKLREPTDDHGIYNDIGQKRKIQILVVVVSAWTKHE